MKLSIIEYKDGEFKADLLDIPGSPPIGIGNSREKAVASLLQILLSNASVYSKYANINSEIEIEYN